MVFGLVPCGAIAGHVIGYLVAGESAGLNGGHGHLKPAAWLAGFAATAALVLVAARPGEGRTRFSLVWLAGGQMAVFLGLEMAEQVADGHGPVGLLWSPSFRWGLVAQVLTATMLVVAARLSRASGERVRALLSSRASLVGPRRGSSWPRSPSAFHNSIILASPASERGPPRDLVPA